MASKYETYAGAKEQYNTDIAEINKAYNNQTSQINNYYKNFGTQLNAGEKRLEQTQNDLTQSNINQINFEKDQAQRDYEKEQKAAYVDWQKQSNEYGAKAESQANLIGSGYSESSQVAMYTAYQNRVATARESYNDTVAKYNLSISDAKAQNNAKIAELAFDTLKLSLSYEAEKITQLINAQQNQRAEIESAKNRYQSNISDVRDLAQKKRELEEEKRQFNKSFNRGSGGGSSYYSYSSSGGSSSGSTSTNIKNNAKTNTKNSGSDGWVSSGKQLTNLVGSLGYSAGTNLNNLVKNGILKSKKENGTTYYKKA